MNEDTTAPPSPATAPGLGGLAIKIGVMGGASGQIVRELLDRAHALGRAIAIRGCALVTGACPGLPLAAACGAKQAGGLVVGISPGLSLDEHRDKYGSPTEFHDVIIFTGSGLMGREVVNIRSSDIVVIVGGRSGTLGELAISYDEGKLIGVLTGTGGVADLAEQILTACRKETGARVIYEPDPERLVDELLRVYREQHHRKPSCFCNERPAGERDNDTAADRDPVCHMPLSAESAVAERHVGDRRFLFCSLPCVQRFDAEPQRYAAEEATGG